MEDVGAKLRDRELQAYHRGYYEEKEGKVCIPKLYKNANEQRFYMQGHLDAQKEIRSRKNGLVDC